MVVAYNATTGAVINANFITGLSFPTGLAVFGKTLFVADLQDGSVGAYNATTGSTINANFITGLIAPVGLAVSGNTLFVVNHEFGGAIGKYDATTGAAINATFLTGPGFPFFPFGIAVSADQD
jgi:outer membrane protein assembly factor BamB